MTMERIEEEILSQRKSNNANALAIFTTKGSAGNNPLELAKILATLDLTIKILGWQDKPLAGFSAILTQYQASLDAKYHDDFKDVLVAEEIEKRRAERKGISIMSQ